jgi:hypothetical protein
MPQRASNGCRNARAAAGATREQQLPLCAIRDHRNTQRIGVSHVLHFTFATHACGRD